jgi:hypothetical protein
VEFTRLWVRTSRAPIPPWHSHTPYYSSPQSVPDFASVLPRSFDRTRCHTYGYSCRDHDATRSSASMQDQNLSATSRMTNVVGFKHSKACLLYCHLLINHSVSIEALIDPFPSWCLTIRHTAHGVYKQYISTQNARSILPMRSSNSIRYLQELMQSLHV